MSKNQKIVAANFNAGIQDDSITRGKQAMMKLKCRLVNVKSEDQEDFADLIGEVGLLQECSDGYIFRDLDIHIKGKPKEDGDKITVRTKMGNVFTFKKVRRVYAV